MVKFHWPELNYILMTYHKEGWEVNICISAFILEGTLLQPESRGAVGREYYNVTHSIQICRLYEFKMNCKCLEWQSLDKITE